MSSHPSDGTYIRDSRHSELYGSPDWFRDLVEHSQDLLCVHDLEGRLLSVNPGPARLLGYSVEEILQKPLRDLLSPKYRHYFDAYLEEIKRNGESSGLMAVITRAGETRIWQFHNTLRSEGLLSPVVRGIAHDVTDRIRAEKHLRAINEALIRTATEQEAALQRLRLSDTALRASEARERARAKELQTVLDAVPVPVYISRDRGCRRITGNRAACEQLRVAPGQNFSKSAPADELPTFRVLQDGVEISADSLPMQQAAKTGEPIYERFQTMVFEDGTRRETLMNAAPLLNEDGEIQGAVGAEIDLTAWKGVVRALRESEFRFRAVYERSPVGICLVDSRSGRFLQVNPKCCEIAARSEEELLRINVASITHPDDLERGTEYLRQLVAEELTNYEMEKRYVRPDGTVRWVRVLVVPMWKKGESHRWHMALVEDVTDRKQTEEALRQSEERFRVALKNSPIAVFTQDRDLRYTWMYNSQLPWSGTDKLGKTPADIFAPEEAERIAEVRRRVLETGSGVRCETQITHGGKKFYLDTTIEPLLNSAGTVIGITGASLDVTELREKSEALREAKRKLTEEKLYLEKEIDTELGFGEIVGQSKALQKVMEQVAKVAASNATVLLLGETGTGKELVARAIHRLSERHHNSFIKMNCAAIPSGLLESELFGHEKGAFTGAIAKKVGRLELADNGTLFLDEIGEIALPLQPKLLRVLQDQEFERLGGTHTLKVNFRLIAATNSDLADRVQESEFRSDLFYRLNVFPIRVPPLRERGEDIRLLVEHFVQKCARRMNKSITSIPKKTMDALMAWHWPGNVRELENFIERSVILTEGSVLAAPVHVLERSTADKGADETLESAERDYILRALKASRGQIGGLRGAAMRLGLKRTTLQSKMKHLGINPRSVKTTS
jgi:PAS domain S-box-containing protein